ncbi:MAG: acyl-CoA dehydrogenase family protein [Actinobacteria bacterium]|nr:acyl-CoA dehydrogenase family protein [Actinomycetota bacterium]
MGEPIDPLDPVGVDELLRDDERSWRDRTRAFVADHVLAHVEAWHDAETFPVELVRPMGDLGLLGMHLQDPGCAGASAVSYGLACMELEAGDSGLRSFVSVQGSLAMYALSRFGSDAHRGAWLPRMAAGEAIGCFGLTEPTAGSNPAQMRTSARRDGSDWVLDGHKRWSTNGIVADVAIVWAQTDDGVRGFVIPTDTDGFSSTPITGKRSLRASAASELHLDEVRLPADAVLPDAIGMGGPLSCLNEARYGVLWGALGAARSCYAAALEHATSREQFGRPIGGFQLTQAKLVDMALELVKGTLLALHLGRRKDAGELAHQQTSVGKLNNTREAIAIARTARGILGGDGVTDRFPVMRHMQNLESVLTYEGTEEMHTLILGETITGLRAFT